MNYISTVATNKKVSNPLINFAFTDNIRKRLPGSKHLGYIHYFCTVYVNKYYKYTLVERCTGSVFSAFSVAL